MIETTSSLAVLVDWTEQAQAVLSSPNTAYEAVSQMHTSFGELHLWYSQNGYLDQAEWIRSAYDQAMDIYNQGLRYEQVIAVGQTAISALEEQRNLALRELAALLDALKHGNEAHPMLMGYASAIRRDEREATLDSDEVWMMADESLVDDIYKCLTKDYVLPFKAAKTLLNMIQGAQPMDEQQRAAFDAFWPMIDPDRKGAK